MIMKYDFLHVDTNSENPKLALVIFGWSWSVMGVYGLGHGTLKFTVIQWLMNWADFWHADAKTLLWLFGGYSQNIIIPKPEILLSNVKKITTSIRKI